MVTFQLGKTCHVFRNEVNFLPGIWQVGLSTYTDPPSFEANDHTSISQSLKQWTPNDGIQKSRKHLTLLQTRFSTRQHRRDELFWMTSIYTARLPHTSHRSTRQLTEVLTLLEGPFNSSWVIHRSRHDLFRRRNLSEICRRANESTNFRTVNPFQRSATSHEMTNESPVIP